MLKIASDRLMLICVLICASFFLFANLGNHYLWQDEAETALLGKSILKHGLPFGTDGINFFSQQLGAEYGPNYLWRWHTWLPFYLTAGAFALLGEGTLAARLPFAIFGVGTIFATYLFALELWANRRIAIFSSILLTLCVPFLLLCRQSRYYSLSSFFTIIGLYFYARLNKGKKYAIPLYLLSFFFLFQSNFVHAGCLLCANLMHSLLSRQKSTPKFVYTLLGAVLIVSPWLIWQFSMKYSEKKGGTHFILINSLENFVSFSYNLFTYVVPHPALEILVACVIAVPVYNKITTKKLELPTWRPAAIPFLFIVVALVVLSAGSPAPYFRYLAPCLAPILILVALIIERTSVLYSFAWLVPLALFVSGQQLPEFFYEITHDYNGPVGGIVKFLNDNAKQNDTVAITYEDLPLKFYTPLRVIGGLTGEDLSPARFADWVIIRKNVICEKDGNVRNYLLANLNPDNYQPIKINSPDIPYENRESPEEHHYRTVQNEDPVVIFRKIR